MSLAVPASFEYFNSSGSISLQTNMTLQMEGGVGRDPQYQVAFVPHGVFVGYGPSCELSAVSRRCGHDLRQYRSQGRLQRHLVVGRLGKSAGRRRPIHARYFRRQHAIGDGPARLPFPIRFSLHRRPVLGHLHDGSSAPTRISPRRISAASPSQYEANNAGHEVDGSASNLPYWNELQSFPSSNNMSTLAAFEQIQGNNPNGTPNSSYTDLLNMADYIDYMLLNFYIGNTDWPWHNWYAAIDTADPTGFDFFSWDAEMSLGMINGGFNSSRHRRMFWALGPPQPAYRRQRRGHALSDMYSNPEFDMAFADQVAANAFQQRRADAVGLDRPLPIANQRDLARR